MLHFAAGADHATRSPASSHRSSASATGAASSVAGTTCNTCVHARKQLAQCRLRKTALFQWKMLLPREVAAPPNSLTRSTAGAQRTPQTSGYRRWA